MRLHRVGLIDAGALLLVACVRTGSPTPQVTLESPTAPPPAKVAADTRVDARVSGLLDGALLDIQHGQTQTASRSVLSIVCDKPIVTTEELAACPPPGNPETASAWVLVGELAFEGSLDLADGAPSPKLRGAYANDSRPDQLPLAEMAFSRALRVAPSRMPRALVLYKLGWARYRLDRFDAAIGTFLETLAEIRASGQRRAGEVDLRDEAIEYAAISIAETDWDCDGQDDPVRGFARPEVQAHLATGTPDTADLYARVVSVLIEQSECADATAALAATSRRYPHHPKLPDLAQSVAKTCP